jgi:carboxyl-terminal processing protease
MRPWQKGLIAILAALAVGIGVFSAGYSFADRSEPRRLATIGHSDGTPSSGAVSSARGLDLVDETFSKIRSMSVDPPSQDELARGAIKGMAKVLKKSGDHYALFYSPRAYRSFQELTTGQFSGIGVWVEDRKGNLEILSVLPDTPALRAGLRPGDVIVSVDGNQVKELSIDEAIARIKGKEGTDVTLGVRRDDEQLSFTITRATIELPNLMARMTAGNLGYIHLFGFARGAGDQVRQEVEKLTDEGAEGVILDLRDNGGGLFSEGVEVASVFVEDGEVVTYEEKSQPKVVYNAEGDAFEDIPLVVLVNGRTASASEIVTGALQDRDRATVVGTRTFGKGSVQEVVPLSDSSALKLTIGAYFTPDGTQINGRGIEPDVVVDAGPKVQKHRAIEILRGIALSSSGSEG